MVYNPDLFLNTEPALPVHYVMVYNSFYIILILFTTVLLRIFQSVSMKDMGL